MVISIIAANVTKVITQYNHTNSPVITFVIININMTRDNKPAPVTNPIAAIAKPFKRLFDKKAIRAIRPNITEVIPNVIPKIYQGINAVMVESMIPIKIV